MTTNKDLALDILIEAMKEIEALELNTTQKNELEDDFFKLLHK